MRAARRAPRARCASDAHAPERPVPCRFASARGGHATNLLVTKFASRGSTADSVALVDEKSTAHSGHHIGIAHTRWATHGGKTDAVLKAVAAKMGIGKYTPEALEKSNL